jgi:hypothetical protein
MISQGEISVIQGSSTRAPWQGPLVTQILLANHFSQIEKEKTGKLPLA